MFLVILALVVTAIVADVAVESAFADGTSFVGAGQDLATGIDPEIVILAIAGASAFAAILLVGSLGRLRRRGRRVDLSTQREELSQAEAALESRRLMIEGRLDELQRNHDEVLAKRDELLREVERLRARDDELERQVRERHREISAARRELEALEVAAGGGESEQDDLTVVPDIADTGADRPRR